jgi:hypothetical protein
LGGGDDLVVGVGEADEVQLDGFAGVRELCLPPTAMKGREKMMRKKMI